MTPSNDAALPIHDTTISQSIRIWTGTKQLAKSLILFAPPVAKPHKIIEDSQ
jgi:hypothetical protein